MGAGLLKYSIDYSVFERPSEKKRGGVRKLLDTKVGGEIGTNLGLFSSLDAQRYLKN